MKDKNNSKTEAEIENIYSVLGYDSFMVKVMTRNFLAGQIAKKNLDNSPYRH